MESPTPQTTDKKDNEALNAPAETLDAAQSKPAQPARKTSSLLAFVITVCGWAFLSFYYWVSAVCAVAGIILSIIALRQPRGLWRNFALTSIVASSVLALILIIFWGVLIYLLSN